MGNLTRQKTKAQKSSKKIDGVIEAVRRDPNGRVEMVRFYERRGPTWSDYMLLNRNDLVRRLKKGEHFVIGERKIYWGGTFNVFTEVQLSAAEGKEQLTTSHTPNGNVELKEAPLF